MTYGEYLRRNMMSGAARLMLININSTPLSFGDKRDFQAKEITGNDVSNFKKDLEEFIAERLGR